MKKNAVKTLIGYMEDKKLSMIISMILATLGEICGLIPYYLIAKLISDLYKGNINFEITLFYVGASILTYLLKSTLTLYSTLTSHKISFTILKNIRMKITDKMTKIPMGEIIDKSVGEFKNLIVDQVSRLEDSLAHIMPELTSFIIAPFCTILFIFILNWKMGLMSLATIPIGLLFYLGIIKDYKEKMNRYTVASNEMNSNLVEYINGIEVIKAFSQTTSSYEKFSDSVTYYHDCTMDWWKQSWFWNAGAKAVMPSTLLGTLPLGAYLYMNQEISLQIFIMCIILPLAFIGPLLKVTVFVEEFSFIKTSLNVIESFLDTENLQRPTNIVDYKDYSYIFDNVSFSYNEEQVLKNISFTTKPRTITAIVGPSGSGKSTIAKLMAGFWDVKEGSIKYRGHDIKEIPSDQLMEDISYVAQDNFLFDMSIIENIKIGKEDATEEEVVNACKIANCHDFIMTLPNGYETIAGDGGSRLSGGERQRITLARAVLKDAQTIILDEATAYADPETDYLIQEAVNKMVKNKTLIVVAHRLSTIQKADNILVLDNGKLVEQGNHNELLESSTLYNRLWEQHMNIKKEGVD
jgi:ATP-binding cassette subfamily B protein